MKTSKMLGAVALTAALAMGTVPAFAAISYGEGTLSYDGTQTSVGDDKLVGNVNVTDGTASGDTAVYATSYVPQLNVTIPIEMGVAFPADSGNIIFPSDDAYQIKNNSTTNGIKIASVEAKSTKSDFTLDGNFTPAAPTATGINCAYSILAEPSAGTQIQLAESTGTAQALTGWTISPAVSDTTASTLPVKFSGKATYAAGVNGNVFAMNALKIANLSYVVESAATA